MDIKKILMASLLVCSLAACQDPTTSSGEGSTAPTEDPLAGEYAVKLWVSETEGVADQFSAQIEAFEAANPGIVINQELQGVSEADSATQMLLDIDAGADLYCFAQDQFARLVQGGALSKLGLAAAEVVRNGNDAGAVGAVTSGEDIYAYPLTSDNGYFMYYDKTVVQESSLDSLTAIIADCEKAERKFSFEVETSAWYIASWFFAVGCTSTWDTADDGTFTGVHDDFNSDLGLIAAKGMKELVDSPCYLSSSKASDFAQATPSAVVISGTWDYNTAVEALGDNLGVADLPSFEVDGKSYHLGSYSGNKLLGVKPTTDAKRSAVLHKLAQYLTGAECQQQRCEEFGWGPSNVEVAQMECVTSNPALAALAQQNQYAIPQGQIHGAWWDLAKVIGTDVKAATDEAGLKAALQKYADGLNDIFAVPAPNVWGLIGSFEGSGWNTNVDFTKNDDGTWTLTQALAEGDMFKARIDADWSTELNSTNVVLDSSVEACFDITGTIDGTNIVCKATGNYVFTINPTEKKLYITKA